MKNRVFTRFFENNHNILEIRVNDKRAWTCIKYGATEKFLTWKGTQTTTWYAIDEVLDYHYSTAKELLDYFTKTYGKERFMLLNGKLYEKFSISILVKHLDHSKTKYFDTLEDMLNYLSKVNSRLDLDNLLDLNLQSLREFIVSSDLESLNNE